MIVASFMLPVAVILLSSCEVSAPPAKAKSEPAFILKLVPWASDDQINAYFTLADANTNQVAANGQLKIQIYTTTSLSFSRDDSPLQKGPDVRNILYDGILNVGVSNFHWETFGSVLKVNDLACHFVVPYANFSKPVKRGKMATVEITFRPDNGRGNLRGSTKISLY